MMTMYENVRSSFFKFLGEEIASMKSAGIETDAQVFDFDAHVDMKEFPETDLVGPSNYSFTWDDNLIEVQVAFGVSTINDEGMFRHHRMVGHLTQRLKPGRTMTVVNAQTGQPADILVSGSPLTASPMAKTDIRGLQFIRSNSLRSLPTGPSIADSRR